MPSHKHALRTRTVSQTGSYASGFMASRQSVSMGRVHIGYLESVAEFAGPITHTYIATDPSGEVIYRGANWREARATLRDHALESIQ